MEVAIDIYKSARAREDRDELILGHLDDVRHVLGRMTAEWPPGLDSENLEAAGVLGLVQAAEQFDPARGVPFQAFARQRIQGAIIDEVRRNSPLPQELLRRLGRIRRAFRELGPRATTQHVARHAELSPAEVDECLAAERFTRVVSGDDVLDHLLQPAAGAGDEPQQAAELSERRDALAAGIQSLPEQEQAAISLYYLEDLRLKEIGQVLGLSVSRVSRILSRAELRLAVHVRRRFE